MVLVFTASSVSCSSKKREYREIRADDTWYECSSFEVSDLYPSDVYEYCYFDTVGATEDSVFIKAEALKHSDADYSKMTEEDYIKLYEQSILELSYEGELLGKTVFDPVSGEGIYKELQKAWIFDGALNLLEQEYNTSEGTAVYYLNGELLDLPKVSNYYDRPVFITDIYTSDGYTLYKLYVNSWSESFCLVRPDGKFQEIYLNDHINGGVDGTGDFIPSDDGKVMMQVYLSTGETIFISVDLQTGNIEELEGLYGTYNNYWLEYASGKTIARDYHGISIVDETTGKLTPVCGYIDINALLTDVMESQLLYISDDGKEIISGCETYDRYSNSSGYKIMHMTRAASNPNAGKKELIISSDDLFIPGLPDYYALQKFNSSDSPVFFKYVLPVDGNGEYKEVDADLILSYDPAREPSDRNNFLDLTSYLDLTGDSYKDLYFGNAIDAARDGNAIYRVPLDISASGIMTASSNVPQGQKGFTFDSYERFVDEVCNGKDPMSKTKGFKMGKSEYFTKLFMNMSDLFINDGKAHLNGDDIRELMLFVDKNGSDVNLTEEEYYQDTIAEHNEAVQAAINAVEAYNDGLDSTTDAVYGDLYSFGDYIGSYTRFGEGLGIYGLPSFDGRGPMTVSHEFASISSNTSYPDECAEFIRLLLSYDIQIYSDGNPINRAALRTVSEKILDLYNADIEKENAVGLPSHIKVPQESIDKYIDILSSSYSGMNAGGSIEQILREESSAYFSGDKALEDVIPVMQKRVQTVLDEAK